MSTQLRAALIGCGQIAGMHAGALIRAGIPVAATCDRDAQKAQGIAALAPGARPHTDLDTMLAAERPDVVHILTPPSTHAALAQAAARAGAHVLVEKPVALSVAEADAMIDTAARAGVVLASTHNYLCKPSIVKARRLVDTGAIGDVVHVDAYYGLSEEAGSYGGGGGHWAHSLPGGAFTNFLPHLIYLVRHFLASDPQVTGVTVAPAGAAPTELTVLAAGGAANATMTVSMRTRPYAKYVRIFGTEGIVHADLVGEVTTVNRRIRAPRLLTKAVFNLETVPQLVGGTVANSARVLTGSMRNMPDLHAFVRELYAGLEAGRDVPADGADGRAVVAVMEQIWERMPAPASAPARTAPERAPRTTVEERIAADGPSGTVLVTGAAGYLGRHVAAALWRCGFDVRALVRDPSRVPAGLEACAEIVTGNLVEDEPVAAAAAGVDLVVHCAAVTTNNVAWAVHQQTNVEGTQRVMDAAVAGGVRRVVHISSVAVYGVQRANGRPLAESDPLPAESDRWAYYERSKSAAERVALGAKGVEVAVVRPGILYGPGLERPLLGGIVQLGPARLAIGDGTNRLPLTYVDNAVDAVLLALVVPEAVGRVYNVVDDGAARRWSVSRAAAEQTGEPVRLVGLPATPLRALAGWLERRAVRAGAERPPRLSRYQIAAATRDVGYDTSRARDELGWVPAVDLREGVRRTFDG